LENQDGRFPGIEKEKADKGHEMNFGNSFFSSIGKCRDNDDAGHRNNPEVGGSLLDSKIHRLPPFPFSSESSTTSFDTGKPEVTEEDK
jgi:hypothetical protein